MFLTASSANRVVSSDLRVTYATERVAYTASGATAYWYKVTRTASKRYSYVNLTARAALAVADKCVANYTRAYYQLARRGESETHPQSVAVVQCQTEVVPTRVIGNIWKVDVSVTETDVRAAASEPADPSALFTVENARSYDEGEGGITLGVCEYDAGTQKTDVYVTHTIPAADMYAVFVQYKASASAEWSNAENLVWNTARTKVTCSGPNVGNYVRVVWGYVESDVGVVSVEQLASITSATRAYHVGGTSTISALTSYVLAAPFDAANLKIYLLFDGVYRDATSLFSNQPPSEYGFQATSPDEGEWVVVFRSAESVKIEYTGSGSTITAERTIEDE